MTTRKLALARLAWLAAGLALGAAIVLPSREIRAAVGQPSVGQTRAAGAAPQTKPPAAPQAPTGPGGRQSGPPGQPRTERTPWWQDEAIKKELGLTELVSRDIDRIYQDRERTIAPFVKEMEKARDELNAMMAARSVDPDVIALQAARLESLNARIRESRWVMLYKMHRKLTPEQSKKLQEIFDRNRNGRGGGRGGAR